jgi:hypothetical protein
MAWHDMTEQCAQCKIGTSKTRVPRAHQSTPLPCPLFSRISGAKYSGVPQNVFVPPSAPDPVHYRLLKRVVCECMSVCVSVFVEIEFAFLIQQVDDYDEEVI